MPLQGKSQSNREKILSNISKALQNGAVPMPFPDVDKNTDIAFVNNGNDLTENFALEFAALGGKFVYCQNEQEMLENILQIADNANWKHAHCLDVPLANYFLENGLDFIKTGNSLAGLDAGISTCEVIIARTGSIILSSALPSGRALPVYSPVHIAIAYANQIVWDVSEALTLMHTKYKGKLPSMLSLTTGPSRTADIEKTLVVGVHGPKEVYLFFIDKNAPL